MLSIEEERRQEQERRDKAREYYKLPQTERDKRSAVWLESFCGKLHSNAEFLSRFGIPPRFVGKTLDNLSGYEAKVDVALGAVRSGQSVFLTGGCGSGKTHLAVGLMLEWLKRNLEVEYSEYVGFHIVNNRPAMLSKFLPAVELFAQMKVAMSNDDSDSSVVDRYSGKAFLVLDDVGAERVSDWSRQMFYLLVDRRYRANLPTVITSNLSLNQIAEQIDDRIASRITEMGPVIHLDGADRRLS